jgi:CxxC motif-containing protein (DUF1111 family)
MKVFAASLLLPASLVFAACSQAEPTAADPSVDPGASIAIDSVAEGGTGATSNAVTEAPTGFDNLTNGFSTQADFDAARDTFEEVDDAAAGLGPVFNNTSCVSCHQTPVAGAGSQITELRAGHFNGTNFVDAAGGSLINDRALDASIQEHVPPGNEVRAFRMSISLMGDGYVEAVDSNTLAAISLGQPAAQRGTFIQVPVLEAPGNNRGARFGWKNQISSLLTFASDAYINEIGITNRLATTENSSNGNSVAAFDTVADPEDVANDIDIFTLFMRSLKAPPRGPITTAVTAGQTQFNNAGCAVCHVGSMNTVTAGTVINGGAFTVPAALGDKTIHPFSDFLLHDIGTGDGIVQNGGQGTRNQVRTAALWGIRARDRLMHDGLSFTVTDAIARHRNQGQAAQNAFNALSAANQANLVAFVNSL